MSGTEHSKARWVAAWITLGLLAGGGAFLAEPHIFQASTTLLIVRQRVPEWMVAATVADDLYTRLDLIQQEVLSRSRLERIVLEFDLYSAERRRMLMEDVIERMRQDIQVDVEETSQAAQEASSFAVSFKFTDPRTARTVSERLASLFAQEGLQERELRAQQIEQVLAIELEDVRRQLLESERAVADARRSGAGALSQNAELEILIERFKGVAAHREAAKLALSLQRRQLGERFMVVDGAQLTKTPVSPTLVRLLTLGALAGLSTGLVLSSIAALWRRRRKSTPAAA